MKNPWLCIPADDYEAHMSLPQVAQAQALSKLMAKALKDFSPESLAVIGCTTGNGLEHIDPALTKRVVGVDINPDYLAILESRYAGKIPGLELIQADIIDPNLHIAPVDLVFAGLVFEYVDVPAALRNIDRMLSPGGILLAVLQRPSPCSSPVTPTAYKSLELLAPIMNLIPPADFAGLCADLGLEQLKRQTIPIKRGKAFFAGSYRKTMGPDAP